MESLANFSKIRLNSLKSVEIFSMTKNKLPKWVVQWTLIETVVEDTQKVRWNCIDSIECSTRLFRDESFWIKMVGFSCLDGFINLEVTLSELECLYVEFWPFWPSEITLDHHGIDWSVKWPTTSLKFVWESPAQIRIAFSRVHFVEFNVGFEVLQCDLSLFPSQNNRMRWGPWGVIFASYLDYLRVIGILSDAMWLVSIRVASFS